MTSKRPFSPFVESIPTLDETNQTLLTISGYLRTYARGVKKGTRYDTESLSKVIVGYADFIELAVSDRAVLQCGKVVLSKKGQVSKG